MKNKTSLISIAIILSVGLITSMTAYAHTDNTHMSDNSTQRTMPMKGGMGMGNMSGMGMGGMMDRCQNMMIEHGHQSTTATTTTDALEQVQ